MPCAPAAICIRATTGVRWVLEWGRIDAGLSTKNAAIVAMLRSSAGRSISGAGVGSEATGWPIDGWSLMMPDG